MSAVKVAVLGAPSKALALLGQDFSVTPLDGGSAATPIGVVAGSANAREALAHVVAKPETVNALALIAPPALDAQRDKEFLGTLAGVTIPVLALFGTRDPASQASGAAWRKALPTCNVTFVYDASGDMANERPEAVAAALRDFMRQRERYVVTDKDTRLFP